MQSQGRARIRGALFYALIDIQSQDAEKIRLGECVKYNIQLAAVLQAKAAHVGENEEIDTQIEQDQISPFKPSDNLNGSEITAMKAVELVYQYCHLLSCDGIATLTPISWNEERICKNEKQFKARVMLPILSPVREVVEGDWMANKTLAKRSVFLKCYIHRCST